MNNLSTERQVIDKRTAKAWFADKQFNYLARCLIISAANVQCFISNRLVVSNSIENEITISLMKFWKRQRRSINRVISIMQMRWRGDRKSGSLAGRKLKSKSARRLIYGLHTPRWLRIFLRRKFPLSCGMPTHAIGRVPIFSSAWISYQQHPSYVFYIRATTSITLPSNVFR